MGLDQGESGSGEGAMIQDKGGVSHRHGMSGGASVLDIDEVQVVRSLRLIETEPGPGIRTRWARLAKGESDSSVRCSLGKEPPIHPDRRARHRVDGDSGVDEQRCTGCN